MSAFLFYGFAVATLVGAVAMIANERRAGVAAFCFVGSMVSLAGIYVLLDAVFVAAVQLVLYAGGVGVVLAVVGTVLEPAREAPRVRRGLGTRVMAAVVALLVLAAGHDLLQGSLGELPALSAGFGGIRSVGQVLLDPMGLAFLVVSLLLLSAIVGLAVLTRKPVD